MAPYTSPITKGNILFLKRQKYSDREVAALLGDVSKATVSRVWCTYQDGRSLYHVAPKSGRPHKLTHRDARFTALALAHNAADIQRTYFPHVSASTVRRRLRELGLRSYVHRRVPLLKIRHLRARYGWARVRLSWTQAQWDDIIFSNESRFRLFGSDGRLYYWRWPKSSPYDPHYTKKLVAHGGGGVMVCGCISREGVGRLRRIEGTMNAAKYVQILQDAFLGSLADWCITPFDITFQHDRDPKHTSRHAQRWLSESRVNVLPWPAGSPDLNIIEHVWSHLEQRLRSRSLPPQNQEQLWGALQEEWGNITPDYIGSLYDSLPRRVNEVVERKGGNTHY
jgi:transposase